MIKGLIKCTCGQSFTFETIQDTIQCPACFIEFEAAKYGEEEVTEQITLTEEAE